MSRGSDLHGIRFVRRASPGAPFLFPDAEMGEDVAEDVVGVDCPGDFTEVMQRLACIDGNQVARHALAKPISD